MKASFFSPYQSWALIQTDEDCFLKLNGPFSRFPKAPKGRDCVLFINDYWLQNAAPYLVSSSNAQKYTRAELLALWNYNPEQSGLPDNAMEWSAGDQNSFLEDFSHVQKLIACGKLSKAVPFSESHGHFPSDPSDFVQNTLLRMLIQNAGFPLKLFALSLDGKVQLGATPEPLFELEHGTLRSMALAGTRPRSRGLELLQSPKELREHAWVVEDLQARLEPFGEVELGQICIRELPQLSHLCTPLKLKLQEDTSSDFDFWVKQLHPTPALGPSPRGAREWLESHFIKYPTRDLGAPLGVLTPEKQSCLVRIRFLEVQVSKRSLRVPVGCGVIAESRFETEWQELFFKRQSVRKFCSDQTQNDQDFKKDIV